MQKKLNIGCGNNPLVGYINIDKSKKSKADKIIDLEKGKLPYKTNSISEIIAFHVLEHIQNIIPLMNECYRVLSTNGRIYIQVPQGDGMDCDPTHVRRFNKLSFRYYCGYPLSEIYGIKCKFKEIKCSFINNADGGVLYVILEK